MGPGRRVSSGEDRRNAVNSRIRNGLRERLEASAEAAGRTLSHEIEERLERSFDQEDDIYKKFGDAKNMSVLTAIASAWMVVELASGKPWNFNEDTTAMARRAANSVIDLVKPIEGRKNEPPTLAKLGEHMDQDLIADLAAEYAVGVVRGKGLPEGIARAIIEAAERAFGTTPPSRETDGSQSE